MGCPDTEFREVISNWFSQIRDKIESCFAYSYEGDELEELEYRGFPLANCPRGYIPLIDSFSSVSFLENLRERIDTTKFSPSVEYLKEDYLSMIDCRINEIRLKEKCMIPLSEVKEIEETCIRDEYRKFSQFEVPEQNPLVRFKNLVSDYTVEELESLSQLLRARNYGFGSPQSVVIDTVRASKGDDIEIENLINISSSVDKEEEKQKVEKRVRKMVDKMNPYILGTCLSRVNLMIENRRNLESLPLYYTEKMSLGLCVPLNELYSRYKPNHLVVCSDDANMETVDEQVPHRVISDRNYTREKFEDDVMGYCNSIFTHEFGHLVGAAMDMYKKFSRDNPIMGIGEDIRQKISSIRNKSSEYGYMLESDGEFVACSFDMWINNPEWLKEEFEEVYEIYENNLSKEARIEDLETCSQD